MLEASRQHVNNREVGQGTDHRCPNKSKLGDSLDPNDEISNGYNQCLRKSKERQKHPSRHITLDRAHGTDFLVIDLELENNDKRKCANPQRKVRKERRHRGTIRGNWEDGLGFD